MDAQVQDLPAVEPPPEEGEAAQRLGGYNPSEGQEPPSPDEGTPPAELNGAALVGAKKKTKGPRTGIPAPVRDYDILQRVQQGEELWFLRLMSVRAKNHIVAGAQAIKQLKQKSPAFDGEVIVVPTKMMHVIGCKEPGS